MAALTFNNVLREAGVAPETTRLVRHQDNRGATERTPYNLWLAQDSSLERYQQLQSKERFKVGEQLASFVATPFGETLFVGLYDVTGRGVAPVGTTDPVTGSDVSGIIDYSIQPRSELATYIGRLVIDWGGGFRSWVQRADRQDKPIVELRKSSTIDPVFPGFTIFRYALRDLHSVPQRWRDALGAVSGVYLLASNSTGKLYVGSAYGEGGFWARWENYYRSGHGGNVGMRPAAKEEFQVSILEVASSTATEKEIIKLETLWKEKLLSRQFGFNLN